MSASRQGRAAQSVAWQGDGDWRIERLVAGGEGLARLADGRVGFVPGVAPGERVRVLEAARERGALRARRWELAERSPGRVEPSCPFAATCGGCDWMHLSLELQRESKLGLLRDALRRTGGVAELPGELRLVSAPPPLGYRSRVRVHVGRDGRVGMHPRRSRDLVEIDACPVALRETDAPLGALQEAARRAASLRGFDFDVELRVAPAGPPVSMLLGAGHPPLGSRALTELRAALPSGYRLSLPDEADAPGSEQRWPLPGGVELWAPPQAFTQVHWPVNLELVAAVVRGALDRAVGTFCDLYCGAGNFSLPLAAAGLRGTGIERAGAAIRTATRAAREQQLDAVAFVGAEAGSALGAMVARRERVELAVADPPREGVREVIPALLALAPAYLALCGCDPVTLARDVRQLCGAGYRLESVTGFDMFPQTHHLETLAWLARGA